MLSELGRQESNLPWLVPKTSALPLGYAPLVVLWLRTFTLLLRFHFLYISLGRISSTDVAQSQQSPFQIGVDIKVQADISILDYLLVSPYLIGTSGFAPEYSVS